MTGVGLNVSETVARNLRVLTPLSRAAPNAASSSSFVLITVFLIQRMLFVRRIFLNFQGCIGDSSLFGQIITSFKFDGFLHHYIAAF
jgi:hypothetical protein